MTFFFIAIFALHPHDYHPDNEEYPHFFKMPVLMLILITVLNDGTLISVAYDHVNPSHHPEKWNLKVRLGRRLVGWSVEEEVERGEEWLTQLCVVERVLPKSTAP